MNGFEPSTSDADGGAQEKLAKLEVDYSRLQREISKRKAETENLLQRYVALEEQATVLTSLYISCHRLHTCVDRKEVLETIQEIIFNLIGCEQYVLFELAGDRQELVLVASAGIDQEPFRHTALGEGLIGAAARNGEISLVGKKDAALLSDKERDLTACIPMKLRGSVTGLIALFRLLSHKEALVEFDQELFGVLQIHAAPALAFTDSGNRVSLAEARA